MDLLARSLPSSGSPRRRGVSLMVVALLTLTPGVVAQEIRTADDWLTAYDQASSKGDWATTDQLVLEHERLALQTFNNLLTGYRTLRDRDDRKNGRVYYLLMHRIATQLQKLHDIPQKLQDLEGETAGDDEFLGSAKQHLTTEEEGDIEDLFVRFAEAVQQERWEDARQLVFSNPATMQVVYDELRGDFTRARARDDRSMMLNMHQFVEVLQRYLQQRFPYDTARFSQYDPPRWVQVAARAAPRREPEAPPGPTAEQLAEEAIAEGTALRERQEWRRSLEVLVEARDSLQYLGLAPELVIALQREVARTCLESHDWAGARQAYRRLARAAAFVGQDEIVQEGRQSLSEMPATGLPALEDESSWGPWRDASRVRLVMRPRRGEDPHGPVRTADPRVELWRSLDLTTLRSVPVGPPGMALVQGESEVGLDTDGDGQPDEELDLEGGRATVCKVPYPDGKTRQYGLCARQFKVFEYMGFTFDHTVRCSIFVRRQGYLEASLGGLAVQITDDDLDGRYDGYGSDGIVIARGEVGTLLSRLILTRRGLYEIDVHPAGDSIRYRTYRGPTQVAYARPALGLARNFIIANADDQDLYLDLPVGEGAKIPVGRWRFHLAVLQDRSGEELVWVDGRNCEPLEVPERGNPVYFEIGREMRHHWEVTIEEKELRVHGLTFRLEGVGGEIYQGSYPTPVLPMVSVKMPVPGSRREIRRSGQGIQRDSRSPHYAQVEYPKDYIFEFEAEAIPALSAQVDHPVLGLINTPWEGARPADRSLEEDAPPEQPGPEQPGDEEPGVRE